MSRVLVACFTFPRILPVMDTEGRLPANVTNRKGK